jgi:hypothetical protein
MMSKLRIAGLLAVAGLALVLWGGTAGAQEAKQLMLVYTTDTNGEVNPCG